MSPQTRILIVQPLPGIGDIAWFYDHYCSLRKAFPQVHFTLLTKASSHGKEILRKDPAVDQVFYLEEEMDLKGDFKGPFQGPRHIFKLITGLKRHKFDQAWIFHKSWRYIWAARLAGIPCIRTYEGHYVKGLRQGNTALPALDLKEHPIQKTARLLESAGVTFIKENVLQVCPEAFANMERFTKPWPRPRMVLGIGASEASKKWPLENFAALASWLRLTKGASLFILGGKKESSEAQALQDLLKKDKEAEACLATDLTVSEAICLLKQCDGYIGNDTGMMNLAAILNKPALGIFLSSPPLHYRRHLYTVGKGTGCAPSVAEVQQAWDRTCVELGPQPPSLKL